MQCLLNRQKQHILLWDGPVVEQKSYRSFYQEGLSSGSRGGGDTGYISPPKIRKKSLTVKLGILRKKRLTVKLCLLSEIISKTCLFFIKVHFCRSRLSALTLYSFVFRHLTQPQMVFLGRCVSPPSLSLRHLVQMCIPLSAINTIYAPPSTTNRPNVSLFSNEWAT